jgi:hypothetical protein
MVILAHLVTMETFGVQLKTIQVIHGLFTLINLLLQVNLIKVKSGVCLLGVSGIDFDSAQSDNGVDYLTFKTIIK